MQIPKAGSNRQYRVTIPALNGGVNLKDAPNLVDDNQLTAASNMWWKDQALRTRPGLYTDEALSETFVNQEFDGARSVGVHTIYKPGDDLFDDGDYTTAVVNVKHTSEVGQVEGEDCTVKLIHTDGSSEKLGGVSVNDFDGDDGPYGQMMLARSSAGSEYSLLLFHAHGSVWERSFQNFKKVTDFYVPTVFVNGTGYDRNTTDVQTTGGTMYEGFNLLTGAFKASYTTDGKSNFFRLPFQNLTNFTDETVEITLTQQEGDELKEFTFTIPYDMEWATEEPQVIVTDDDYGRPVTVHIYREDGQFGFVCTGNGEVTYVSPSAFRSNNLVIRAWKTDAAAKKKICGMTINTWFGGDRSGLAGGTRLFVSGNPQHPNLVHWSDINNPLYFPENNYAYIGGADQAVTAFGKQADMLVIFKEHEVYYATYASRSITGEEVQSGAVVDVTANIAYFPITQLHGFIGCDCPGSMQLCNNRLVWADSAGKVYALCSANSYSDRSIVEVGDTLGSFFDKLPPSDFQKASSAVLDNYYMLQVGDSCLLMDITSDEFLYTTSYTSREGKKIPWYIWDLSPCGFTVRKVSAHAGKAIFVAEVDESYTETTWHRYQIIARLEGPVDTSVRAEKSLTLSSMEIPAMFQTKTFDFGYPERRKAIRRLHIGATDTRDDYIHLSYITESGTWEDAQRLGAYGDGEMREWCVTPSVRRVRQFGMRAASEGTMAVYNLVLRYEINGEAR